MRPVADSIVELRSEGELSFGLATGRVETASGRSPGPSGGVTMVESRRGLSGVSRLAAGTAEESSATRFAGNHSAQPARQTGVLGTSTPLPSAVVSSRSLPDERLPSLASQ